MFQRFLVGFALVFATVSVVHAQRPEGGRRGGGGGGGLGGNLGMLLTQPSVQEELKLTDDQKSKAEALATSNRGGWQGMRDLSPEDRRKKMEERSAATEKSAAEFLQPDQLKRLKQISWQQQGVRAYSRPEVVAALALNDEQKQQIQKIQDDAEKSVRDAFEGGGGREGARGKMEEINKAADEKLASVLTSEQKAKFKDLVGEPFKGEIRFRGPGGEGGRPRR